MRFVEVKVTPLEDRVKAQRKSAHPSMVFSDKIEIGMYSISAYQLERSYTS
jgi:hypothetical protein